MADQTIPLPDGTTADFPADWTPGMIQSKLWDQFPQWRPKGPVTAFTPWDPAQGQGNEATQEFPSYDAYLDQRKEQQRLGRAQGAEQGPEIAPTDELTQAPYVPANQRGGRLTSELRPVMQQVAQEWGVTPSNEPKVNQAMQDMVQREAERRIKSGTAGAIVRGVQEGGVGLGKALTEPLTVAAVATSVAVPPLAIPIWAGFTAQAASQLGGSIAGGAPAQQLAAESTGLGVMLLPGATKSGRAGAAAGLKETFAGGQKVADFLAPMTTRAAAKPTAPPAAPTPVVAPVAAPPSPAATSLANLATGLTALENAAASVAESGTVPYANVNRALNNLRTQLESARRATRAAGARTGAVGAQPAEAAAGALEAGAAAPAAAAEAAYLAAKKAIADANAAAIRNQLGVVDAQQVAQVLTVALAAARNYHTALGSTVSAQQQATQAPTPKPPPRPAQPFATLSDDAKFEYLAQKNAAGAAVYSPEELAFANAITRDPAQLARFNARRQEIEAHAKAGTVAPATQPTTPGEPSASSQPETTAVGSNVPAQPQQVAPEVPVEGGGPGVQPEAQGGIREPETVAAPQGLATTPPAELLVAPKPFATTPELPGPTPDFIQSTPSDYLASALGKPELSQVKGTPFEGTVLGVDPATATKESLVSFGKSALDDLATVEAVAFKRLTPSGTQLNAGQMADAILAQYRRMNGLRSAVANLDTLSVEQLRSLYGSLKLERPPRPEILADATKPQLVDDLQNRLSIYDRARALQMGLLKHRMAVASALERGESVPTSVLRQYPDLAKRYHIGIPKPKPFEVPPEQTAEPTRLAPEDARASLVSPEEYKATMEALAKEYPEEKTAPVLSRAEIDHLLDYTRTKAQSGQPMDLRNNALVELLYSSGLRTTEARLILLPRIHWPTATEPHGWLDIAADTAKGNKQRNVPVTQEALDAIAQYMRLGRPLLLQPDSPPSMVFLSKNGGEIAPVDVWRTISGLGKKAGLPKEIWTHMLRHTFASQARARGVPESTIMEWLGHTRESTTQAYLHPEKPGPSDASMAEYEKFAGRQPPPPAQPPPPQAGQTPGFFPRRSEAQALGEPSMPPTVEDVRRQRAAQSEPGRPDDYVSPELLDQSIVSAGEVFQEYQRKYSYSSQSTYLSELFSDFLEANPKFNDQLAFRGGLSSKELAEHLADAASIMAKKAGTQIDPDIAKAVDLARKQNPEIDDVVAGLVRLGENYYNGIRDFSVEKIIDSTGIDRQLAEQAMKDPQVWPEIRAEVYQADPGLGKFIDTHVHPSYVPPEAYLSPDKGTQRGDPPDLSVQSAQQAAISGWALHGLPRGVNPGPPSMAAQLMAAGRRIRMATQSDAYLRPDVEGHLEYSAEVDRAYVADVKNQRTIAHEMGHVLNSRLFPLEDAQGRKIAFGQSKRSLVDRARAADVTGVPAGRLYDQLARVSELMRGTLHNAYRRRATELIADHFSLYAHDRAMASQMAPDWTRVLENQLSKPGNADLLETVRQIHAHDVEPVPGELEPGVSSVTQQAVETPDKIGVRPEPPPAPHNLDIALASRRYVKDSVRNYAAEEARARAYRENAIKWFRDRDPSPRTYNPLEMARREKLYVDQLKDVGAFIEGSGNIERQGDDIGAVRARMTKPMKDFAVKFAHDMEHQRQRLNQYLKGVSDEEYIRHLDDYLPHFYVQNEQFGGNLSRFLKDSPSAKARVIPSFAEAVRYGFRPITQNPATLYEIYGQVNWRVAANRKLVGEIAKLRDPDGNKVILPASDPAAVGWKDLGRNPMFERFVAYKKPGGQTLLWKGDMKAHPSVYAAIRQVIEHPIRADARMYDWLNSITRSMAFSLSGFHDVSLSLASVATQARWFNPLRGLVRVGERDPVSGERKILQTTQSAGRHLGMQEDVVADAALHGLRSAWADSNIYEYTSRHAVDATLRWLETKPVFNKMPEVTRVLRKMGEYRQKSLWSWTHDAFKLMAYHDIVAKALERAKPGVTATDIKEQTASFLNDAFGGQDWQTQFWQSPQTRRVISRFLLAPDWTLSTVRSVPLVSDAASLAREYVPRLWGRKPLPGVYEGMRGNLLRAKLWTLEALAAYLTSRAVQWAFYQLWGDPQKGDQPNMLENEKGEGFLDSPQFNVDVTPVMRQFEKLGLIHAMRHIPGVRALVPAQESYENTRHYMNMGKRFAEVARYILDPMANIESKVSRPLAESIKQFSGRDGAFDADWKQDETGPQWHLRLKSILQNFLPFSVTGNQFMMTQPAKKGMTNYKAQQAFEAIIEIQADPSTFMQKLRAYNMGRPRLTAVSLDDLRTMVAQVFDAARRNGANPELALSNARGKVLGRHQSAYSRAYVNMNNAMREGDEARAKEEGQTMLDEMEYMKRIGFTAEGLADSFKAQLKRMPQPVYPQPTAP